MFFHQLSDGAYRAPDRRLQVHTVASRNFLLMPEDGAVEEEIGAVARFAAVIAVVLSELAVEACETTPRHSTVFTGETAAERAQPFLGVRLLASLDSLRLRSN